MSSYWPSYWPQKCTSPNKEKIHIQSVSLISCRVANFEQTNFILDLFRKLV